MAQRAMRETKQLKEGDRIYVETPDSTRILCQVVRAPQQMRIPHDFVTFWIQDENGDLHMVSSPPDHYFELEEKHNNESGEQSDRAHP